ncbi:unnamed protein product [Staurois parvus]|uniref:Uncharacterized protein n=1 Tax=Staurois parvus TaxID=386267 RepID=A0ABN9F6D8_9NEOB|nr:unnamed protein product [Staurois parvus]
MTRDCGHSTGDDQRLWTVQEMTADLWGGGGSGYLNLTGTRFYFFDLTCSSIQPCAVFPASVVSVLGMTAGCPMRMSEKRCAL